MPDPINFVTPSLREKYSQIEQERHELEETERQLNSLIELLERQKQEIRSDPSYSKYAYVTHDDLKKLTFNKGSERGPQWQDEQSLLIAIQTPHGSLLNIFQEKEPGPDMGGDIRHDKEYPGLMQYLRESYHLVINAETDQTACDEQITVF